MGMKEYEVFEDNLRGHLGLGAGSQPAPGSPPLLRPPEQFGVEQVAQGVP